MKINEILSDIRQGIPLDIRKEHNYLQMLELTQVFEFGDGWTPRYRFRSLTEYYYFLLVHFIQQSPNIALCECCGRYFIPKTKKKTLYCDRVLMNGKTCKELVPSLKHKLNAKRQKVIEEFDRAKRRMYKRYERTDDIGAKPKKFKLCRLLCPILALNIFAIFIHTDTQRLGFVYPPAQSHRAARTLSDSFSKRQTSWARRYQYLRSFLFGQSRPWFR